MLWSYLLHLSFNMWRDFEGPDSIMFHPDLRVDDRFWHEVTESLVDAGANSVVIDLGDGVLWDSHPEISVRNAWTRERLVAELDRLRSIGLEPLPKFNFSTCHDAWLGPYARQVSSPVYYEVTSDLITEAAELFDHPRFFHLGLDEENYAIQRHLRYVVIRQGDLWWHDVEFFLDQVRAAGSRPWVWSDPVWHDVSYLDRMPTDVVQSNWYYRTEFTIDRTGERPRETLVRDAAGKMILDERPLTFLDLDERGFDQIPTGSSFEEADNLERLAEFVVNNVSPRRLLGFLQTPWQPTQTQFREAHIEAIAGLSRARKIVGEQ